MPFSNCDLNCNALPWGSLGLSKNLKVCPAAPPHPLGCQPAPLQATCKPTRVPHHASSPTHKFAQPRISFGYSKFCVFCFWTGGSLSAIEIYFWWSSGELFCFFLKSVAEPHVSCNHKNVRNGPKHIHAWREPVFYAASGREFLGQATYDIYGYRIYIYIYVCIYTMYIVYQMYIV